MMPKLIGSPYAAIPVGLSWGLVVWLLMGVIIGPALDPALREAHPTHYLVAHLLYGLCSVVVLRAWMGRQRCRPHAAKRSLVEERARARARSDTIV
jgi:hypothetical protein